MGNEYVKVGKKKVKVENGILDLSNMEISSTEQIKGLDTLINLRKLYLSSNKLTRIKDYQYPGISTPVIGLDALTTLEELNLAGNQISEIYGLESLTNLRNLSLYGNKITEIQGLESLTNLIELDLSNNQISEIKGLESLKNLQKLSIYRNKITKIKGLESLTNLKRLHLRYNNINEIKGLESLINLEWLNVDGNNITKIKGLGTLTKLQHIYLSNNPIPNELIQKIVENYIPEEEDYTQKFVRFCQLGGIDGVKKRQQEAEERERIEEKERLVRENPCEICGKELKEYDCPDCGRTVCTNCWDTEILVCVACKKKLEFLKEVATPPQTEAVQSSQTTQIPDKERYLKLRNALQMSEEIPLSVLAKSLNFPTTDDLSSWLIECGIIGLKVDYKEKMIIMTDPEALEMLEILMQENN
ncbi:MAG: leucine-rich repeat protein [Candidatus Hermodarchaeota archaeon]